MELRKEAAMRKMYDVYFTLETPAVMLVAAESEEEAEDIVLNMHQDDLMDRVQNAIDFMGFKVVEIEKVD